MNPRICLTMGVLAVVLTAPACSGGSETENPYRLAASGLCEASTKAETGDASGAGEVFYDIVHQPLHDLAAETSEVDRAVAARLLEAKEAVESGFDTNQPDLNEDFRALVVATDEALAATGHDPLACSSSEGS